MAPWNIYLFDAKSRSLMKKYIITKGENFDMAVLTNLNIRIIDNTRLFLFAELSNEQYESLSKEIGKGIKAVELEKKYKLPETKKKIR